MLLTFDWPSTLQTSCCRIFSEDSFGDNKSEMGERRILQQIRDDDHKARDKNQNDGTQTFKTPI